MANELRHGSVGTDLTQAEWESITGHSFASQATGDILYASSATQLSRLAVGSTNDFSQVIGGIPAWVTNPTLLDNSQLRLGTGGDSALYYDGTDSFWDLRRVGTGDLMIALAGSFPSPDPNAVHIWKGTAGLIAAHIASTLILENSTTNYLSFLSPNNSSAGLIFGDPEDTDVGYILYQYADDRIDIRTAASDRVRISANTFAFQENTTINSTGTLTITSPALTSPTGIVLADYTTQRLSGSTAVSANVDTAVTIQAAADSLRHYTFSMRSSNGSDWTHGARVDELEAVLPTIHSMIGRPATSGNDILHLVNGTASSETAQYEVREFN